MLISSNFILVVGLVLGAYLIGSISSAILLCRLFKLPDPRISGSKNPGTTNVLRVAGKSLAASVLLFDVFKGFLSVYIAKKLGLSNVVIITVAFAVFFGHLFPIFFSFIGGKGVATTLGIILALCWPLGVLSLIVWILVFLGYRISSLAAIITTLSAILLSGLFLYFNLNNLIQKEFSIGIIFLGLLIILKHKKNIYNLFNRVEGKV